MLRFFNAANVCSAGFYRTCIPDGEKVTSARKEAEAILITSTSLTVEKWKWATQNSSQQTLEHRRVVKYREKHFQCCQACS